MTARQYPVNEFGECPWCLQAPEHCRCHWCTVCGRHETTCRCHTCPQCGGPASDCLCDPTHLQCRPDEESA